MCKVIGQACVAILLTMSTKRTAPNLRGGMDNATDRMLWYKRSLNLWNQDKNSKNAVVVVQNSPPFKEYENIETIQFQHSKSDELKFCGEYTDEMGEHELISIHKALQTSKILKNATHVIKITGRYFIPSAFSFFHVLNTTKIIHMNGFAGGCQIMGCRKDVCAHLWRCPYKNNHHCEATIKYRMHKYSESERFALPILHTAYTLTGSGNAAVTHLP